MREDARRDLCAMIGQFGAQIIQDKKKCHDALQVFLRDTGGVSRETERQILRQALEAGIPSRLINAGQLTASLFHTEVQGLQEGYHKTAETAQWAVISWAMALKLVDEAQIRALIAPQGSLVPIAFPASSAPAPAIQEYPAAPIPSAYPSASPSAPDFASMAIPPQRPASSPSLTPALIGVGVLIAIGLLAVTGIGALIFINKDKGRDKVYVVVPPPPKSEITYPIVVPPTTPEIEDKIVSQPLPLTYGQVVFNDYDTTSLNAYGNPAPVIRITGSDVAVVEDNGTRTYKVKRGVPFSLTIEAENRGGDASIWSITADFENSPGIEIETLPSGTKPEVRRPGDEMTYTEASRERKGVYHLATDDYILVQRVMAEGYAANRLWGYRGNRTMTMKVTPSTTGTMRIWARATMTRRNPNATSKSDRFYHYQVNSADTDQQGFNAKVISVDVVE